MATTYFANLPDEEILPELKKRWDNYHKDLKRSGQLARIQESYKSYYGTDKKGSLKIEKSDGGSITHINVNQHRNVLIQQKQLITSNKLSTFVRARTSDSDALSGAELGKNVADHYDEEIKMSNKFDQLVETGIVCLDAFILVDWNRFTGEAISAELTVDPLTGEVTEGQEIFAGDIEVEVFTPLDVARPTTTKKPTWHIVRKKENKYDLMAMYPKAAHELESYINQEDFKDALNYSFNLDSNQSEDEDYIHTYTLYHAATPACKEGMVVKYVQDIVLDRFPLKQVYEGVPLFRFTAGDVISSVYGHGTTIDVLPIQQAISALFTAVVTNNINLAFTNVYAQDANTDYNVVGPGTKLWTGAQPPVSLALANSSPETYQLIQMLIGQITQLSGNNDVTRGTVGNTKLTSGNALALLLTQAINFVSSLQRDYADVASQVFSQIIKNIRLNAKVEMIYAITGKSNKSYVKTFKSEDLYGIDKIVCELQNPVMSTQAGRIQVADSLLESQMLDSALDYVNVLTTGDLPSATNEKNSLIQSITEENEHLKEGESVPVIVTDRHDLHFASHISQLNFPETRRNPQLVQHILDHAQEHLDQWKLMTPDMLAALQMPPCPGFEMGPPPAPGMEGEQGGPAPEMPTDENELPSLPNAPGQAPPLAQGQLDQFEANLPANPMIR